MKTIRFRTRISKSGTINLPKNSSLIDKEVVVIIMQKSTSTKKTLKAKEFVEKWAGFLNPQKSKDSRYDYLMGKYK